MIVADTSAVLALLDADDRHHAEMHALWEADPDAWILPWAILPEVDYLVRRHLRPAAARLFLVDIAEARFMVEHSTPADVVRAAELDRQYDGVLGLVDGVVAAVAERLRARAIATLDVRHFGKLRLKGAPLLYPRDC